MIYNFVMKIAFALFVGLFLYFGSQVMVAHALQDIHSIQPPPDFIMTKKNVNYTLDLSDYAYSSFGTYYVNQTEVSSISQAKDLSEDPSVFKIYEKNLGGWDQSMPALYLTTGDTKNDIMIFYDYLQDKTDIPKKNDSQSISYNFGDNIVCYDVVAVSTDTVLIDCAEYDPTSQIITKNWIYWVSLTNDTIYGNSSSMLSYI